MNRKQLAIFLKLSHPQGIIVLLIQFLLGISLAKYFGKFISIDVVFLGGGWLISFYLGSVYMLRYFENLGVQNSEFWGDTRGKVPIQLALLTSAGFYTSVTLFSITIFSSSILSVNLVFISIVTVVLGLLYINSDFSFSISEYKEFILSVWLGILVPLFGFSIFSKEISFSIVAIVTPTFFLLFSLFIIFGLFNYGITLQSEKKNILTKLGWETGLIIHNLFYGLALLWIVVWGFLQIPNKLIISILVPFPLILLQFRLLKQMKMGAKPNWNIIKLNSIAIYTLMNYMIIIFIWTN